MRIRVKRLKSGARLPRYAHPTDAGLDLFAAECAMIRPGERKVVWDGYCD